MKGYQSSGFETVRVVLNVPFEDMGVSSVRRVDPSGELMVRRTVLEGVAQEVVPLMIIFAVERSSDTDCRTRNWDMRSVKVSSQIGFQGPLVFSAGPHCVSVSP